MTALLTKERVDAASILCLVLSKEKPHTTLRCVRNQTVVPSKTLVVDKIFGGVPNYESMILALNDALSELDLDDYGFILRLNGDVYLPDDFIEKNLGLADVVGKGGDAMIFNSKVLKAMGGKFPMMPFEDAYFIWLARKLGFTYANHRVMHFNLRPTGKQYGYKQFIAHGHYYYKLGYEPFHIAFLALFFAIKTRNLKYLWTPFGYVSAVFKRERKWDVAEFVRAEQVRLIQRKLG